MKKYNRDADLFSYKILVGKFIRSSIIFVDKTKLTFDLINVEQKR